MDTVRAVLVKLNLSSFDDKVLDHLVDKGFEDHVPVSVLVPALREVGIRTADALEVKKFVSMPTGLAAPTAQVCLLTN
jgi:hypothetical protein